MPDPAREKILEEACQVLAKMVSNTNQAIDAFLEGEIRYEKVLYDHLDNPVRDLMERESYGTISTCAKCVAPGGTFYNLTPAQCNALGGKCTEHG
jgi:hypothetical protein